MFLRVIVWRTILVFLWVSPVIITWSSLALAKVIDLRNSSDSSGDYELGFCARPSPDTVKHLPGHAFVSYSYVPSKGQRTFVSIGHTVVPGSSEAGAVWSYFGKPVEGYLKEEMYTSSMEQCLRAKVNKREYDAAYALTVNPLKTMGISTPNMPVFQAYKLGESDCMEFLIQVASTLKPKGLRVPDRAAAEFPIPYIVRFINSN